VKQEIYVLFRGLLLCEKMRRENLISFWKLIWSFYFLSSSLTPFIFSEYQDDRYSVQATLS